MKLQIVTQHRQQRFASATVIPFSAIFVVILVSLPTKNDAAENIPSCDNRCAPGGPQSNPNCASCCMQAYRNDFATGSCDRRFQPKKCICDRPKQTTSGSRNVIRRRNQPPPKWSFYNSRATLSRGVKPKALCMYQINAARQNVGAPTLKYNGDLESAAKSSVNYMIKYDFYDEGCRNMPHASRRVGWLTRRKLKVFTEGLYEESYHASKGDEMLDCNILVRKWSMEDKKLFLRPSYTDVGCFAARCKHCKWNLNLTCAYGRPK